MTGKTGNHDHQRNVRADGQADFFLQCGFAGGFAFQEGFFVIVRGQRRIGCRIEGVDINAVGNAGELLGMGCQNVTKTMGIIRIHQFLGVSFGNSGDQISGFDGALHGIDRAVHVQTVPIFPRQSQHVVKETGLRPALILDVMNGIHTPGFGEERVVLRFQHNGNQGGLPVIALDHIGDEIQRNHCVQTGLGEIGKALTVIHITIDGTGTGTEVIEIIDEIDLDAIVSVF